jgi:Mg-chelatase subunit ChlD
LLPLTGWRRTFAIASRVLAMVALGAALGGFSRRVRAQQPQHVVYLVDGSSSIDAQQRAWIARRIASLEAVRPSGVRRALVIFGGSARMLEPFGTEPLSRPQTIDAALSGAQVARDQTNLEEALLETAALLPPGQPAHLVLFSDGWETAGNSGRVLAHVRRLGLRVFPESLPVFGQVRTVWDQLSVPPVVERGAGIGLRLVLYSHAQEPREAQISVSVGGVPLKRERAAVRPGWQVITVSVPAIQQGTMALDVGLTIQTEGLAEHRRAYTEVQGPPNLLLVHDAPTTLPILATALKRREIEVSMVRPGDLPARAQGLLDYDAVLLFNVPKTALGAEQAQALSTYVSDFGGGVFMVGLGGELAQEVQTVAPLDPLLPVTFEAKGVQEAKRRVCLVMLIDRSASMFGPRLAATKRAAVEMVNQLSPDDFVGVLAFDTQPYIVVEVQPASRAGGTLVEKLVKLRSSGGTDIYPALKAAQERLNLTDAKLKHIILLSDGNTPYQSGLYRTLMTELQDQGISISAVGVGAAFVNTDYLEWLTASSGGTFYQLRSLEELPRLVAQDTQGTLGRLPFTEGAFRPERPSGSSWLEEVSDWPTLRGYLTAAAKPGAQVELAVRSPESVEPLLVRWAVGRGRVASFLSDADTRWSPDWIRWPGFDAWAAQVVRWVMRRSMTEELFAWVDERSGLPQLMLEGDLQQPKVMLTPADADAAVPLSLAHTGRWRWQAALESLPHGWYALTIESGEGEATSFGRRWIQIGAPPASVESAHQPPRESALRDVAHATSGVFGEPDRAFVPPTTMVETVQPLLAWWLPLVILLLLAEIAVRGSTML